MPTTMYDRLGGMAFFEKLVGEFYARVADDDVLRPLYPEDLGPSRRHLELFLAQFFGGSREYDAERGAPRLRARHLPFRIGPAERDHWLEHMTAAIDVVGVAALERAQMLSYFEGAANHLMNC